MKFQSLHRNVKISSLNQLCPAQKTVKALRWPNECSQWSKSHPQNNQKVLGEPWPTLTSAWQWFLSWSSGSPLSQLPPLNQREKWFVNNYVLLILVMFCSVWVEAKGLMQGTCLCFTWQNSGEKRVGTANKTKKADSQIREKQRKNTVRSQTFPRQYTCEKI